MKLLQSAQQPVYLLDASRRLIFGNRALEEWTGCGSERLLGEIIRYHTPLSRLRHEIVAAALCPPPELLSLTASGKLPASAEFILSIDRITSTSRRRARFLPLHLDAGSWGILAIVDPDEYDPEKELSVSDLSSDTPPMSRPQSATLERFEADALHRQVAELRRRMAEGLQTIMLAGNTQAMRHLNRQALLAASTTAPVLIVAEPGCGAEVIAQSIHDTPSHYSAHSTHSVSTTLSNGALLPIDCRVLSPALIIPTVNAFQSRCRRDASNKRHSVVLNHVDMLPMEMQPILSDWLATPLANLQFLATSPIARNEWGDKTPFFHLLATIFLEIPPLRRRQSDIPLLAQMFLETCNTTNSKQLAGLTSEALDLLSSYSWPGNLDEMERVIAESHQRSSSPLITAADLPERLHHVSDAQTVSSPPEEIVPLEAFLEEIERELLARALRRAQGNKSKAAGLLAITRPKLYRRLEQLGMLDEED